MGERMEKLKDRKYLVSLICVLLGGYKSEGIENFFCLVEMKNERIENRVGINLP